MQATIDEVTNLYERGLYLQAYEKSKAFGPLAEWRGAKRQILAGRLASNLGAPRLGRWLHLRAWRSEPADPLVCYFHAWGVFSRRGPLAAWKVLKRIGELSNASPTVAADWCALHAHALGMLRDFEIAWQWLDRAETIAPDRSWVWVERSYVLAMADRYADSLKAAEHAFDLCPWYRPGVEALASAFQLVGRDRDAFDLLSDASERLESGSIVCQLAALALELGQVEDARGYYDRLPELFPLMEEDHAQWLSAIRCDVACRCGDLHQAAELASAMDDESHRCVARHLAAATAESRRVQIDVTFVRQHHLTCAPATLAAISRYWSMPAEHLNVAERICYDGTPAFSERRWAEENGYIAREFTVDWNSAKALLDRGVPFTLTTVAPGAAHLQAAIGYDSRRGTLLSRDPSARHVSEIVIEILLEYNRSTGPRGMLLVPRERAELVEALALPDVELYDLLFALQGELDAHRRTCAQAVLNQMLSIDARHRLTLYATRAMAAYDNDMPSTLAAVEAILEQFPKDVDLILAKLWALRALGRRDDRIALIEEACASAGPDPLLCQAFAQELAEDGREHERALRLIHSALRQRPLEARSHYVLGNLLWAVRRFEEAFESYRFAVCLNEMDEEFATAYFGAARQLKRSPEVLQWLHERAARLVGKSSFPTRTLFWALCEQGSMAEAFERLEAAIARRPGDGELLLFAAECCGRFGRFQQAAQLLEQAQTCSRGPSCSRAAALLAGYQSDPGIALAHWRDVLASEPVAEDAHAAIAHFLSETLGRDEALAHLEQTANRWPHNVVLHRLWVEWLRGEGADKQEAAIRRFLELHPADAWGRRELALVLGEQRRFDDAFAEMDLADRLEPQNSMSWGIRGHLHAQADNASEAKDAFRRAIQLSVDNQNAHEGLLGVCRTDAERKAELEFIYRELLAQPIFGDGLLAYRDQATVTLDPVRVLDVLREGLAARPDLWHAWAALLRQLVQVGRLDEAAELARKMVAEFPMLAGTWMETSAVSRALGDLDAEIEAITRALEIAPGWDDAAQLLSQAYQRAGNLQKARDVLEGRIARAPLNAMLHGNLAEVLRALGDIPGSIGALKRAVELEPANDGAWDMLASWSAEIGEPQAAAEVARDRVKKHPAEARAWYTLARMLHEPADLDERLAALGRALEIQSRLVEAHDLRATLLAEAGRADEALKACRPSAWPEQPPPELRAREAWIKSLQGSLEEAIAAMRLVIEESPMNLWARERLADWQQQTGDAAGYLESATQMVHLASWRGMSWGYRGHARSIMGDPHGARTDFAHAIQLDPSVGPVIIRLLANQRRWHECGGFLRLVAGNGEIWHPACAGFLEAAGEARAGFVVRLCLFRHRRRLRADSRTWGSAGYALQQLGDFRAVRRWLSDWRTRQNVRPWMLLNLAVSLRMQNRHHAADQVHRHALAIGKDHTTPWHALWMTAEEIIQGLEPSCQEQLAALARQAGNLEFYSALHAMIRAMLEAAPDQRRDFAAARKRLDDAFGQYPPLLRNEPLLRQAYFRFLWRCAKNRRRPMAAAWARLRSWRW